MILTLIGGFSIGSFLLKIRITLTNYSQELNRMDIQVPFNSYRITRSNRFSLRIVGSRNDPKRF